MASPSDTNPPAPRPRLILPGAAGGTPTPKIVLPGVGLIAPASPATEPQADAPEEFVPIQDDGMDGSPDQMVEAPEVLPEAADDAAATEFLGDTTTDTPQDAAGIAAPVVLQPVPPPTRSMAPPTGWQPSSAPESPHKTGPVRHISQPVHLHHYAPEDIAPLSAAPEDLIDPSLFDPALVEAANDQPATPFLPVDPPAPAAKFVIEPATAVPGHASQAVAPAVGVARSSHTSRNPLLHTAASPRRETAAIPPQQTAIHDHHPLPAHPPVVAAEPAAGMPRWALACICLLIGAAAGILVVIKSPLGPKIGLIPMSKAKTYGMSLLKEERNQVQAMLSDYFAKNNIILADEMNEFRKEQGRKSPESMTFAELADMDEPPAAKDKEKETKEEEEAEDKPAKE